MMQGNRYIHRILTATMLLMGVACQNPMQEELLLQGDSAQELIEVRVAAPAEVSRTEIESNGVVTRWSSGDKIALWAENQGAMTLSAHTFTLWHFGMEFPTAYFTAVINPMTQTDYTYYAAYPLPTSVSGTTASFSLPAVQDGSPEVLKNALMVARPTQSGALTGVEGDELHLDFVHKLHILKITIPETKNLLGEPLKRIELTFPVDVVGTLTTDVADVEAPVTLSEGSRVLSLEFEQAVNAGDVVYAVIAPVDASVGMISFRGYSELRESESIATSGKNFLPGRTTPIRLTIPEMRKITYLYFSVGDNYLGENPNSFTVTVNDGTFPDGATSKSFTVNAANRHEYAYEGEFTDNFSGKTLTYTFESNSAIVSTTTTAPTIQPYIRNASIAADVPYLFTEDFSKITTYELDYKEGPYTSISQASSTAYDLTAYGLSSGWSGARTGGSAGKAILVGGRVDEVKFFGFGGATRAYGRLDSPAMSALKSGVSVSLSVTFNYSASQADPSKTSYYPVAAFGYTNTAGTINGYATQYVDEPQFSGLSSMTQMADFKMNGSWDSITQQATYTLDGCSSNSRLSWHISVMGGNGISNDYHMMYIDNIKVSIVQ